MTDFGRTARPDVLMAAGDELNGRLGPLAAYLHALDARGRCVGAAVLCGSVDDGGGRCAICTGERGDDPARGPRRRAPGGRLRRPLTPDLSQCPQQLACRETIRGATGLFAAPPAKGKRCRRGGMGSTGMNVAHQRVIVAGSPWTPTGHVTDELDHAPRLAAVDASMQARTGPPPERPGLTVSSA